MPWICKFFGLFGTVLLLTIGDLDLLIVSTDCRLTSSLRSDPEGVIRGVGIVGVPTMVIVEGVSMASDGHVCISC
jgi:hypothetical protein